MTSMTKNYLHLSKHSNNGDITAKKYQNSMFIWIKKFLIFYDNENF